uniref:C2H2-type domain-containing protein n=1 Tax=Plectus sambesii TaxID=2011161 RepID=A0A914XC97_9BILA
MSKNPTTKDQPPSKRVKLWNPAIDDDSTDYKSKPAEPKLLPNDSNNALKMLSSDIFNTNAVASFYNPYFHIAPLLANFQTPLPPPKKAVNFYATPRMADQPAVTRSYNPIVASALGRPLDTLNQNCCAMCGTTFRLTGDLVQHMRTNHRNTKIKRSSNKASTKVDSESASCNLVCSICEEVFKDEHHLARHTKAHHLN